MLPGILETHISPLRFFYTRLWSCSLESNENNSIHEQASLFCLSEFHVKGIPKFERENIDCVCPVEEGRRLFGGKFQGDAAEFCSPALENILMSKDSFHLGMENEHRREGDPPDPGKVDSTQIDGDRGRKIELL